MQFAVRLKGAAPDTHALRQVLAASDPGAMVDLEPHGQSLRIACSMQTDQLAMLISQAGVPVAPSDVEHLPLEYCIGGR